MISQAEQIGRAAVRQAEREPRAPGKPFPLTVGYMQKVARRLGVRLGEHRAAETIRLLKRKGVIVEAGSYRQFSDGVPYPTGFRVPLFRRGRPTTRSARLRSSVRRSSRAKKWWQEWCVGWRESGPDPRWSKRLRKKKQLPAWQVDLMMGGAK